MNRMVKIGIVSSLLLAGCSVSSHDKPLPEDALPSVNGAADGWGLSVVDHGALSFTEKDEAQLGPSTPAHMWAFELDQTRTITVETLSSHRGLDPDTVLYLYEVVRGERRLAVRPDDDGGEGYFSRLRATLDEGRYEVIVTGYSRSEIGRFALSASCDDCASEPEPLHCNVADMISGSNPCPDGQYCVAATNVGDLEGVCRPSEELYDTAVAEFVRRFGDDPNLWSGRAPVGSAAAHVVSDASGTTVIVYVVELDFRGRTVALYYRPDASLNEDFSGGFFRLLEDGRVLRPGEPTIFVTAPSGETLDRFLSELEMGRFEHIPLPLQTIPFDSSLLVLGVEPLYEAETLIELQLHFPDHSFDYDGIHFSWSGRRTIIPLATFSGE